MTTFLIFDLTKISNVSCLRVSGTAPGQNEISLTNSNRVGVHSVIICGSQELGNLCGTHFNRKSFAAEHLDTMGRLTGDAARSCVGNISAPVVPTWIFIVLGTVIATAIIQNMPENQSTTVAAVSTPALAQKTLLERLEGCDGLLQRGLATRWPYPVRSLRRRIWCTTDLARRHGKRLRPSPS